MAGHDGAPNKLGEDQAAEARAAVAALDVDGVLHRVRERGPRPVGRQRAVRDDVLAGDRDDDGVRLRMTREPLTLRGRVPGLGVSRRVGPENFVIPDRGDLVEVGRGRVAESDV